MTEFYSTGTVAVTNGSKDFTLTGGTMLPTNVKVGDLMNVAGRLEVISEVTDGTHGKFAVNYGGSTASGLPYSIVKTSASWGTNRELAVNTAELVQLLTTGLYFEWVIALSHEDGAISEEVGVVQLRVPKDITVEELNMFLNQASDSGNVVTDLFINGVSVLSTKLTVEQDEVDSDDAATPFVLVNSLWNKGDVLRVDFLTAGNNAEGAKLTISGQRRN